jgi:glutathione S-transferase
MGRVPTLGDVEVTVFEPGAIVQYVLASYGDGRLVPDAGPRRLRARIGLATRARSGHHAPVQ